MKFLNNIMAKIAGKILKKKLGITEDKMGDKKPWYKSKTILTAAVVVLISVYEMVDLQLGPVIGFNLPDIPVWVFTLLGALGIYTRKIATKKID